jgi:hypothetical protein
MFVPLLTATLVFGCGVVHPKATSDLDGDVFFRIVNHSKDKITHFTVDREAGPGGPRATREVVGGHGDIKAVEPGQTVEATIKGGTYTLSLEALGHSADYNRSTGYKKDVDCNSRCEIVYEDRAAEAKDHESWKQVVLVNSEATDESKKSLVTFVNRCHHPVETLTRNYGSRPHGHGKLGADARDSAPVEAYGSVGFIDPTKHEEVWMRIDPGQATVAISETCNSIALAPAGTAPTEPPQTRLPRKPKARK